MKKRTRAHDKSSETGRSFATCSANAITSTSLLSGSVLDGTDSDDGSSFLDHPESLQSDIGEAWKDPLDVSREWSCDAPFRDCILLLLTTIAMCQCRSKPAPISIFQFSSPSLDKRCRKIGRTRHLQDLQPIPSPRSHVTHRRGPS